MELMKRQIRKNEVGKGIVTQFVVDEDFNVPDAKEDVRRIVMSDGKVRIDDMRSMENHVKVVGKLYFRVLYETEGFEPGRCTLEGKIPFEELIYTEEKEESYTVRECKVDFDVSMIHSRKLNIKAMVDLEIGGEKIIYDEVTVDVDSDISMYKKKQEVHLLKLHTSKKDTYRIKEEITLPGTKETIATMLWSDVTSRRMDTRLSEGELLIDGELMAFCFYESPEGKLDWITQNVLYQGRVECPGVEPSMYHHVTANFGDVTVDVRPDEDGEMRVIGLEGTQELRLAVYEEENMDLLRDVYSLEMQCRPKEQRFTYEEPLLQNHSKCKVAESLSLPELKEDILQICHSNAVVEASHMEMTEEGILIEGVLHVSFLYVKADDTLPFDVWQGMIPFSHVIACNEMGNHTTYNITSALEQLSISLLGGDGVEVKAVLAFHCFLKNRVEIPMVTEIETQSFSMEEMKKRPGIVGYVVKEGDDLWSLAKRYNTTVEGIREVNDLKNEEVKIGERILIFKENMSIL